MITVFHQCNECNRHCIHVSQQPRRSDLNDEDPADTCLVSPTKNKHPKWKRVRI